MRIFERIRERFIASEPPEIADDPRGVPLPKACPFCGGAITRVETLAKSFSPPKRYVEWHHLENFCWITSMGTRIIAMADENIEHQRALMDQWNERYDG